MSFHPVCVHQGELQQEELFVAVEMLSAVALINQALEAGHLQKFGSLLVSPAAGLSDVDPTLLNRCDSSHLSDSHHVDSLLSLVVFRSVHFVVFWLVGTQNQQKSCQMYKYNNKLNCMQTIFIWF